MKNGTVFLLLVAFLTTEIAMAMPGPDINYSGQWVREGVIEDPSWPWVLKISQDWRSIKIEIPYPFSPLYNNAFDFSRPNGDRTLVYEDAKIAVYHSVFWQHWNSPPSEVKRTNFVGIENVLDKATGKISGNRVTITADNFLNPTFWLSWSGSGLGRSIQIVRSSP